MLAAAGISAMYASGAHAFPSRTTACNGCHSGPNVPVTATLATTVGTTATYNVSAPGADTIAVFDGATKLATINAASGQFSVTTGKTYTIYSVTGPGTGDGLGSTTVSPVAPAPVDVTAPVTTSNAVATYVSSASITLSATDAGSGVANTYYRLDGGAQVTGRTVNVSTLGSHTLEFWSVDVAGNIETHKTASFTITAPAPSGDSTLTINGSRRAFRGRTMSLSGALTPGTGDESVQLYVMRPGSTTWTLVSTIETRIPRDARADRDDDDDDEAEDGSSVSTAVWAARFRPNVRGTYQFQVRFAGDADSSAVVSRTITVVVR